MQQRLNISSGAPWEETIGYCRAVRIGDVVEVAGTCAVTEVGATVGVGNPYEQTQYILQKIERALVAAGATLQDVVRTRVYVTDMSRWQEVGKAHGEFFRHVKPASTFVEVSALIGEDLLVEIEATAILGG
jgi:enamine deaminase RidA (YjgF/YER057c/UK114 family)